MAKMFKLIASLQSGDINKIYNKNMAALKQKDAELHDRIAALPPNPYYQLYRDKPKVPYNLFFMEENTPVPYYNLGGPVDGAEQDVDRLNLKNARIAMFFGVGLGYEVLYYLNHYFYSQRTNLMILIEKDPYIFKKALEATDLTDLIRRNETFFYVGLEPLEAMQRYKTAIHNIDNLFLIKCVGIIIPSPSLQLFGEYYKDLINEYKQAVMFALLSYGDSPQDSLIGETQMFDNLKHILENPGINMLYDAFRGKPAIVCGSGPSLQKELGLLKKFEGKVIIITAESTLWPLAKNGIYPNIICTLERDGRPDDYFDEFDYNRIKDTYLAAVPVVPSFMYENYKGPKINAYRQFAHFTWLPVDKGMSKIGASSANMAFKFAHKLGCSPIIIIGQDLCFDRETNATHAPGYIDGANQEYLYNDHQLDIMANDGVMTKTTKTWKIFYDGYIEDIPEYKEEVPGGLIINTSERGVKIPGTVYMPFAEAAEKYLSGNEYDPLPVMKKRFESFSTANIKNDLEIMRRRIDEALSDLNGIIGLCDESIGIVDDYMDEFSEALKNKDLNYTFTPQEKRNLDKAAKIVMQKRTDVRQKFAYTFNMLVMHVVQSTYIKFGISHEEKLGNCETEEARNLCIITDHKEYFLSMGVAAMEVVKVVERGKEIADTLIC